MNDNGFALAPVVRRATLGDVHKPEKYWIRYRYSCRTRFYLGLEACRARHPKYRPVKNTEASA